MNEIMPWDARVMLNVWCMEPNGKSTSNGMKNNLSEWYDAVKIFSKEICCCIRL